MERVYCIFNKATIEETYEPSLYCQGAHEWEGGFWKGWATSQLSGCWLSFGILPSGTYTPFQCIHVSSKVHCVHVYTYREQSVYKLLGLVHLCPCESAYPNTNKLCLATGLNLFTTSWLKFHFPHAIFHQLVFTMFSSVFTRERYTAILKALCQKTKATAKATAGTLAAPLHKSLCSAVARDSTWHLLCLHNTLSRQYRNIHKTNYPFCIAKYVIVGP